MRKFYYILSIIFFATLAVSSCKIDPPVLPDNLQEITGGNGGYSNGSSITYQLNEQSVKLDKNVFFQLIDKAMLPPDGNIQIAAGSDPEHSFSLTSGTTTTGTFDADIIEIDNKYFGSGKVTFTEVKTSSQGTKGTMKGTFEGTVTDFATSQEYSVTGSFNMKQ